MDRLNKFRLFFSLLLLILDLLFLPQVLNLPLMLKEGTASTWPDSLSFFGGLALLHIVFPIWKWVQLFVLAGILWIWFNGRGFVNIPTGDTPPTAGHGQHGTSRWMEKKEIDKVFTVHKM